MARSGFRRAHALLRTVLLGGLLVLAGWWTLFLREKLTLHERALEARTEEISDLRGELETREGRIRELDRSLASSAEQIEQLGRELAEREERIRTLEAARHLLKVDHRVARIQVLDQTPVPGDPERVRTRLSFTELDGEGKALGEPRILTVEGRRVYVETLVIKFDDDYVEKGDALRGTSICLFKRLFGEDQRPTDGVPVDAEGELPPRYGGDVIDESLHRDLWARFWDYANDPDLASELGVRALHGEAPFVEMRPGKSYRLELRSSGGLTLQPE